MKIQTQGSQTFNVPNNEEGREFLKLMEKFRNKGWYYRTRGRGTRKYHGAQDYIPKQYSEWMAVYLSQEKPKRVCTFGCPGAAEFTCVDHNHIYHSDGSVCDDWPPCDGSTSD